MGRQFIAFGALFAFLGVLLGAFGAHALASHLDSTALETYKTGVQYQLSHALALILIGSLAIGQPNTKLKWSGRLMVVGIVLFSFSLYALAITGVRALGAITPFGGVCFLVSWLFMFSWALTEASAEEST